MPKREEGSGPGDRSTIVFRRDASQVLCVPPQPSVSATFIFACQCNYCKQMEPSSRYGAASDFMGCLTVQKFP